MIFKLINSESLKSKKTVLTYLLVISCLIAFSSCMTTESLTVSPDSLKSASPGQITNIKLKNGDSINCDNKIVQIIARPDSIKMLTVLSRVTGDNSGAFSNYKIIPLSEIINVKMEKSEIDKPMTIIFFAGLIVSVIGLIMSGAFSYKY